MCEIRKIFVGNIPYECTNDEFRSFFENLDGFINCDIITRNNSDLSRGFGFVTFDNKKTINALLDDTLQMDFKGRLLRFSPYKINLECENNFNKVFISNLPSQINEEEIKMILEKYGEIENIRFKQKNSKNFIIVQYKTLKAYTKILLDTVKYNNKTLKIAPYNNIINKEYNFYNDPKESYKVGFNAGKIVGYQAGFQEGLIHNIPKN